MANMANMIMDDDKLVIEHRIKKVHEIFEGNKVKDKMFFNIIKEIEKLEQVRFACIGMDRKTFKINYPYTAEKYREVFEGLL